MENLTTVFIAAVAFVTGAIVGVALHQCVNQPAGAKGESRNGDKEDGQKAHWNDE